MNQQAKKTQPVNGDEQPYTFSDEATKEKIKRHLTDIKDVITENDIANVKIPGKENDEVLPQEKEREDNMEDQELVQNKPVTPWDTLEE
ncbi:MAG: hypothetical protein ABI675_03450 [Chitinophagaceae bacterium]